MSTGSNWISMLAALIFLALGCLHEVSQAMIITALHARGGYHAAIMASMAHGASTLREAQARKGHHGENSRRKVQYVVTDSTASPTLRIKFRAPFFSVRQP